MIIQGIEEQTKTPRATKGLSRFHELGIPTVKDEEWKYTSLATLADQTFEIASNDVPQINPDVLAKYCDNREINIVLINGVFSKDLSNVDKIPDGVAISPLTEAHLTKHKLTDATTFVALNEAINTNGTYIAIDEKAVVQDLIHIIHVTSPGSRRIITAPRALIVSGKSSEATILETHVSFDEEVIYFSNALTDIFLGENATLHYCKSQKESLSAFHIGRTRIWLKRDSNLDGFSFMTGSKLARNDLDIVLDGEGAHATLNALYSVYKDQHIDNHTSVDHRVPNCTSSQLYKGILNHTSRAVFNGKIFVRPIAQLTNSYQLNKNLLLGKNCRIDTKPQLEIFADDVKCTHGATIGQLDEDEMFYLQTRCIPRTVATQMLAHGFVDDLFSQIKSDSIHAKLNVLMEPSFEALCTP